MKERNELMRQQRAAQYAQLRANAEAAREAAAQRRRERREARERALQLTEQQNVAASVLQRFVRKRQDQLRAQIEMFAPAHKRSELWNRGASHVAKELERRKIAVAKMQATYRSWVARGRPQSRYDQMERVRAACKLQAHTRMRQTRGEYLLRNDMLVSRAILKQNEEYFETLKRQMDEEASLTIQTYYRGAKVRNSDGLKSKHARLRWRRKAQDPQVRAAIAMQAVFRGHKSRKGRSKAKAKPHARFSNPSFTRRAREPMHRGGTFPRDGA